MLNGAGALPVAVNATLTPLETLLLGYVNVGVMPFDIGSVIEPPLALSVFPPPPPPLPLPPPPPGVDEPPPPPPQPESNETDKTKASNTR